MTLADRKGKTLLVNLWATWCAPCRAEMPALDALQQAKGGADFEVVAINVDTGDDAKPKKFLAETGVKTLAYYRDASMGAFNMLKERGAGARPAGDAAGRSAGLSGRGHERPGELVRSRMRRSWWTPRSAANSSATRNNLSLYDRLSMWLLCRLYPQA